MFKTTAGTCVPRRAQPYFPGISGLAALVLMLGLQHTVVRAAEVSVAFIDAERYTDIGFGSVVRQRNLKTLQEHMSQWSSRLPPRQRLEIEVLDVDLAGMERPFGREPLVRVLNGRVDGPRMSLRWTLREGTTVVASGQDELSDSTYANRMQLGDRAKPLYFDVRMLDDWLSKRVLERQDGR